MTLYEGMELARLGGGVRATTGLWRSSSERGSVVASVSPHLMLYAIATFCGGWSMERAMNETDANAWHLPPRYVSRDRPKYFDDAPNLNGDTVYQPDVYAFAEYLLEATGRSTVLDVGCGSARKLLAIRAGRRIGLDFEANIRTCRSHSPTGTWIEVDLERGAFPRWQISMPAMPW